MRKISRSVFVLIVLLLCIVFFVGSPVISIAETRQQAEEKPKNPYENSKVLVEAFVVKVKLSALYDLGVSPIGQKPKSVTIENILTCLKNGDSAKVIDGAKLAARNNEDARIRATDTVYIERNTHTTGKAGVVAKSKTFDPYNRGKEFRAEPRISPDGRLRVEFSFSHTTFENALSSKEGSPPDKSSREWSGTVTLDAGRPIIVGATQDEETAVFLIICADIRDS